MRILYLVTAHAHAHDYLVDFIYDGLRQLLGAEKVIDWPEKPNLHIPEGQPRDECNLDTDMWYPPNNETRDIRELCEWAELVILAQSLEDQPSNERVHDICKRYVPMRTPVLALDGSDYQWNRLGEYHTVVDRPLLYAKRELPLGADWGAIPCPFTYPESRVPKPLPNKFPRVVYHATHHGHSPPGVPRLAILADLLKHPDIPTTARDVQLYWSQENRPSPEEYHERMAHGLVGISWNGAQNWDCNRFWENLAFGLAQVAEKPRIQIPNPPEHLRHCYYVTGPSEVAPAVALLLRNQTWALSIAKRAHEHFLQYHTSKARAAWLIEQVKAQV